jgi:predicted ATPase/DNA-binding SARP family transcriptional activator
MAFKSISNQPESVQIHLLGDFRVCIGDVSIDPSRWRLRKAKTLVKLLALAPNHRLHREKLMDLLWQEHDLKAATDSLHQALHHIRSVLQPYCSNPRLYIQFEKDQVSLCPDTPLWIDAEAFEIAAKEASQSRDLEAYRAAIALYTGDLLPEDLYEDWAISRREHLRQEAFRLLFESARAFEAKAEYPPAIEAYQRIIASDPLQEEAYFGLMQAYALSGQRSQALSEFQVLKKVLAQELGAEPDPRSTLLYQEILSGRFPPAHTLSPSYARTPPPHNLPSPLSTFVGREREAEQVRSLASISRLVTLTGSGGVGKTRLALRVAETMLLDFPDGVWLVELDSVTNEQMVPYKVAGVFGVSEEEVGMVEENLQESLCSKKLLLILDNCEHLVEVCARLAGVLLQSCPNLHILATSREGLGIQGEVIYHVPTLSLPEHHRLPAIGALTQFEAVRLFVERAQALQPSFVLTEENAPSIVQICQQLDGIPLALELAAARIRILSVEQIALRLNDRFRLLKGGSRTIMLRQQTLTASMDWSYDLLSEAEQRLFCRLSVFVGGWDLAAAEGVCSDSVLHPEDILDLLSQLINKSLVVVGPESGHQARYRLLETLRQYTLGKVVGTEEWVSLRNRHLAYFLHLVEEIEPKLRTAEQVERMRQLRTEQENLRGALDWSLGANNGAKAVEGLRMASALLHFWEFYGLISEGYDWLKKGLALIDKEDARWTALLAKALYAYAMIHVGFHKDQASQILEESIDLYRKCGDKAGLSWALCSLAEPVFDKPIQLEKVRPRIDEALELARNAGDPAALAQALNSKARITVDKAAARAYAQESQALFREMGNSWGLIESLEILGYLSTEQGDYKAAQVCSEDMWILSQVGEFKTGMSVALSLQGRIAYFQNQFNHMEETFQKILEIGRDLGFKGWMIWSLRQMGIAAKRQGNYQRAAAYLVESLPLAEKIKDMHGIIMTLGIMAGFASAMGQPLRAARLIGAEEVQLKSHNMILDPIEQAECDLDTASVRAQLAEAAFQAAWSEGGNLTLEQAVAEALAIGSELNPS